MKEYIEREATIKTSKGYIKRIIEELYELDERLDEVPAAKVAPLGYAYWDWQCDGTHFCSECGTNALYNHYGEEFCSNWCPACGCFMTEVRYEQG